MNNKTPDIRPYIVTMLVTITIMFSIALAGEISLLWKSEKKVVALELSNKIFSKFHTIEELEKKVMEDKDDYKAHIKLAQKYSEIREYDSANVYFQTALKISERSNYTLYTYSLFCIERKLYNMALNHAEEISLYNKSAIRYKAIIYEALADSLDKDGEIEGSIRAYQVALKYAKGNYKKKKLDELKLKYALEYVKLADIKINKKETKSAILDINNSLNIKETSMAKYKLALIYRDYDKQQSERLIQSVLEENPYLVNPYIYNTLLNNLIDEARYMGDTVKINYYNSKMQNFHKLLSKIYIFKDDLRITRMDILPRKSKLFKKEDIYLKFSIKNDTKEDIDNLYFFVELYYGNNKIEIDKKIASGTNPLIAKDTPTEFEIKFPPIISKDDISLANDLIVKCYAKKQNKAPWTLIKIQQLK